MFYSFSAGTLFILQNLPSTDVRFWRIKTVPTLKGSNRDARCHESRHGKRWFNAVPTPHDVGPALDQQSVFLFCDQHASWRSQSVMAHWESQILRRWPLRPRDHDNTKNLLELTTHVYISCVCQMDLNSYALQYFSIKQWRGFFKFEIIINVSVSSFWFIWIPCNYVMGLQPLWICLFLQCGDRRQNLVRARIIIAHCWLC